ncbi:hypothetical protein LIX27_05240 [Leptospira borgpetersenii]|nr:hypothetical protein [Leptospira borgpetersenii]UVD77255.1 hypothetical protein LIX27_05240 [Leptospira borgpetersenii]
MILEHKAVSKYNILESMKQEEEGDGENERSHSRWIDRSLN